MSETTNHDDSRSPDVTVVDPEDALALGDRRIEEPDSAAKQKQSSDTGGEFPGGAAGDGEADTASGGAPDEPD